MAHASTAAFGLGVAGLVTMLVVHLKHKKAERTNLESLTISPRGVALGARF
jgi:hypothetical protein